MNRQMAQSAGLGYDAPDMPPRLGDPEIAVALGTAIRIARQRQQLTQQDLARTAGLTPDSLGRFERGQREPIVSVAFRVARALRMEPEDLIREAKLEVVRKRRP
jgi:transcriptional regulator with XRE-family HTH domain